jgi:hypothetical protein
MKMINDRHPRLEHANLVVSDIDLTLQFLQTAFPDWRILTCH